MSGQVHAYMLQQPEINQASDSVVCWLQDLFRFCLFALCVQSLLFLIIAVPWITNFKVSAKRVALHLLYTLVSAMPVAIPTVIVCSNGACASKLRTKGIHVLTVGKLKLAADVSIVAVDKTGTLTHSEVILSAMSLSLVAACNQRISSICIWWLHATDT